MCGWVNKSLNGWLGSWTLSSESVVGCIYTCTDGWLCECMYEWMLELVDNRMVKCID